MMVRRDRVHRRLFGGKAFRSITPALTGENSGNTTNKSGADTDRLGESDYWFSLANERIFLAWEQAALGLLAAAVAVQFVPALMIPGTQHFLGVVLALLGLLTAAAGLLRWSRVDRAIRSGMPLPRQPRPVYFEVLIVVIGLLAIGFVIVKAVTG